WKDGARGNQLSKASLLLATEALEALFPDRVFYFPSYEIVMDELRDYRFYAADMLHTNPQATAYIWEKFQHSLISGESQQIIRELEPLLKLMEHRPGDPSGEAHLHSLKKQQEKLDALQKKYPFLSWESVRL
ncbi:MAG: GSCFA domain-containing protein, partial [Bacteroidales bacterium]|nr:GSCFA domain-containing protein [Bacteroidales bacterium]